VIDSICHSFFTPSFVLFHSFDWLHSLAIILALYFSSSATLFICSL